MKLAYPYIELLEEAKEVYSGIKSKTNRDVATMNAILELVQWFDARPDVVNGWEIAQDRSHLAVWPDYLPSTDLIKVCSINAGRDLFSFQNDRDHYVVFIGFRSFITRVEVGVTTILRSTFDDIDRSLLRLYIS